MKVKRNHWLMSVCIFCFLGSLTVSACLAEETPSQEVKINKKALGDWKIPKNADEAPKGTVGVGRPHWGRYDSGLDKVPESEFEIATDEFGKIVRVNLLKIKDSTWEKVPGIKKRWQILGPDGSKTRAFNAVQSDIVDVDGDGEPDIFASALIDRVNDDDTRERAGAVERLDYEDRSVIWRSEDMPHGFMNVDQLYVEDLDADGKFEVVTGIPGWVFCFDAQTGKTNWKVDLAKKYGTTDIYVSTLGHFQDPKKLGVVVRGGTTLVCLDHQGEMLWTYDSTTNKAYDFGHDIYTADADGDGLDEVFVNTTGVTNAFSPQGKLLWQDTTQKEHSDVMLCGDFDKDGRSDFIYDHEGCGSSKGPFYVVDAMTGKRKFMIDYRPQGLRHAQYAVVADFAPDVPGIELICTGRPGGIYMWDCKGNQLWRRDAVCGLCAIGDWDGDGVTDLLVFTGGVNTDGIFSVWNGRGERLYAISFLPSPTIPLFEIGDRSHAFMAASERKRKGTGAQDLDGNGKADLLMAFGTWHVGSDQNLFLMEQPAEDAR